MSCISEGEEKCCETRGFYLALLFLSSFQREQKKAKCEIARTTVSLSINGAYQCRSYHIFESVDRYFFSCLSCKPLPLCVAASVANPLLPGQQQVSDLQQVSLTKVVSARSRLPEVYLCRESRRLLFTQRWRVLQLLRNMRMDSPFIVSRLLVAPDDVASSALRCALGGHLSSRDATCEPRLDSVSLSISNFDSPNSQCRVQKCAKSLFAALDPRDTFFDTIAT